MYKLLCKDTLDPNEVRPYRETDLSPREESAGASIDEEPAAVELVDLAALAPFLCLTAAQEKAGEILAEARREAEALGKQAIEEGRALGRDEIKQRLMPALTTFAQAGQSLIVFEERMVTRHARAIVRLALEIAQKIVGKAVAEDPAIVAAVLERARKEVSDAKLVRVRVHPADYEVLVEMRPDLVRMGEESGRRFEVSSSEEIPRGGCRIETEIGTVDATLPTQLEEIQRQLLDE